MLVMQASLYGVFTAQNFVLWFLFYEMSLVPGFLLIKIWGGANRDRAATKFFLYTFLGSVAMLLSFLGIYLVRGTFDFRPASLVREKQLAHRETTLAGLCRNFSRASVKVPLFPFHTWLPDAYEAAPTGTAMVLTGTLSKMGVYGFIRLLLPFSLTNSKSSAMAAGSRGRLDSFRLVRGLGADRSEAHGGLPFHQSPRLLHARALCRDRNECCIRRLRRRRP
jgi:NADH:ubiquinone oxidoreductase subunit 4 (subunit M)